MKRPQSLDLSSMALFVSIVEEGSFSAAARALGIPKATVSRQLAELERQAATPLLARSTRALTLTDAGQRHYDRVRELVRDARLAQAELLAANPEPSGVLRVCASAFYGQLVIAPKVVAFATRYPQLRIELELNDERVNVVADRFDLVVRMGPVEACDLTSRRLANLPMVLAASPAYVARASVPTAPADLSDHDIIVAPPDITHWHVGGEDVRIHWRLRTHSLAAVRLAVLAGLGIGRLPTFAVAENLASGDLLQILPEAPLPRSTATALYPRSVAPFPALRLLLGELQSLSAPAGPTKSG